MRSPIGSPGRRIGVVLVSLMVMTLSGCTAMLSSASFQPEFPSFPRYGSGQSGFEKFLAIGAAAAVGGLLIHKVFFKDSEEETTPEDEVRAFQRENLPWAPTSIGGNRGRAEEAPRGRPRPFPAVPN